MKKKIKNKLNFFQLEIKNNIYSKQKKYIITIITIKCQTN